MRIHKPSKRNERYIPLADIEKINDAVLCEMERVKNRLNNIKDERIIEAFHDVLLSAYNATIEVRTLECEVDYDIKLAEIEERRRNLKPWRRCWLWWLIFQPLTNRAQDIIEARAELEADIHHTAEEKKIEDERKEKLPTEDKGEKLSKRKLKREMRDKLKKVIEAADKADAQEAFNEPSPAVPDVQEPAATAAQNNEQLPGQMTLDDLQTMPTTSARRPRPPRSCRKP